MGRKCKEGDRHGEAIRAQLFGALKIHPAFQETQVKTAGAGSGSYTPVRKYMTHSDTFPLREPRAKCRGLSEGDAPLAGGLRAEE